MGPALLCRFRCIRPRFELTQEQSLAWLVDAHTQAEITAADGRVDAERIRETMTRLVRRFACSADQIASRGTDLRDAEKHEWKDMTVYDLERSPHGAGMSVRTEVFRESVDRFFDRAFVEDEAPPRDLVHVTCTGCVSPSGAQRVVARRGWGARTRVTHAYQMGCYAALPTVRVAAALLSERVPSAARNAIEIAHTEICSAHIDPSQHAPEQVVVQSLFADGFARYAVSVDARDRANEPGLELLATHEAIVPDSSNAMQWWCSDWGMRMVLGRDVPRQVGASLLAFVRVLFDAAGLDFNTHRASATYAVHPGGPRILDGARAALEIDEGQMAHSREVLLRYGNMSSATLPHIWERIVASPDVPAGQLVVSLAFGPGLTMSGALLRKR
jgi:predicted naringenin-chalcone synthase